MDATRARRTGDRVRKVWYAHWRQLRFARFMGVVKRAGDYLNCPLYEFPIKHGSCRICGGVE